MIRKSLLILSIFYLFNVEAVPFKTDKELEIIATADSCLEDFLKKGGTFQSISDLTVPDSKIQLEAGNAVYPVCSGGWCRSQTLWMVLEPYSDKIILIAPHAARVGWDPYNGQINRPRNYEAELAFDDFPACFGREKIQRFGFENSSEWSHLEKSPTQEGLKGISQFYDTHYFGKNQGNRRVYIAFSKNAHVVLYRLNQTNEHLKDVTVVAIESEDIITDPPEHLNTIPRSVKAYQHFADLLKKILQGP